MCSLGDTPKTTSPPRKRRRAHPKSRHGCVTCKKRRIKCDEARPTCSYCVERNYVCDFSTKVDATSVNIDNYPSSATSEVRSLSGIQECSSSAIVQQEQQQQIPISSNYFPGTPREMQNLKLKRKRETPDSPVNQTSKKRRAETYEGQKPPLQTSLAQEYINETPTSTQNSRPKQVLDDAAGKKLEVIIEKLTQTSNEQKEIQTQISRISAWEDLKDKISGQVRAEMTDVVLKTRSMRRKVILELAQELRKLPRSPQDVEGQLVKLWGEVRG